MSCHKRWKSTKMLFRTKMSKNAVEQLERFVSCEPRLDLNHQWTFKRVTIKWSFMILDLIFYLDINVKRKKVNQENEPFINISCWLVHLLSWEKSAMDFNRMDHKTLRFDNIRPKILKRRYRTYAKGAQKNKRTNKNEEWTSDSIFILLRIPRCFNR